VRVVGVMVGVGVGLGVGLGVGEGVGLGVGLGLGEGVGLGVGVGVGPLNVTVIVAPPEATAAQGFVVPEQVVELQPDVALQPPNVDPGLALAVNVIVAPLTLVVIFGKHVLKTV